MRHPTDGVLRRLLDEPSGVADADREHVSSCDQCLAEFAVVQQDAVSVTTALASEPVPALDVDAAWQRLSAAVATASPEPERASAPTSARRSSRTHSWM